MNLIDKKEIAEKYASENVSINIRTTRIVGVDDKGRCIFLTGQENPKDFNDLITFRVRIKDG